MPALKPLVKCQTIYLPGDRVTLLEVPLVVNWDLNRVWSVRECFCLGCRGGRLVCVDQRTIAGDAWRHIHRSRLTLVGEPCR
jgi:hypothetical protein